LGVYTKSIVNPFKAAFPGVTTFCAPSALFSAGNAPAVAAKVLVIGFFRDKSVLSADGGTTGCCDARFDTLPGQVPQRVGGPEVHLYEHQGRIEMQHLGFSCPHKRSLAPQSHPSNILFRLFLAAVTN
jgi:hypothetical protein